MANSWCMSKPRSTNDFNRAPSFTGPLVPATMGTNPVKVSSCCSVVRRRFGTALTRYREHLLWSRRLRLQKRYDIMTSSDPVARRQLLKAGAGSAVGGALGGSAQASGTADEPTRNVYDELGVKTLINAAGTITTLGGSLMPPEVLGAWLAASKSFVDLLELQDRIGERIADLLNVEAAMVTTGAAGGIMVGTAAALTFRDHTLVDRLPLPADAGFEVIRQQSHRAGYDKLVEVCGVKLVDVVTLDDLEHAISERTAMMFSYNFREEESNIKRDQWVDVARRHGIPTLLDAAADTPPVDRLWQYARMGFDMVVFSGGKGLRGPQDAGLLLGRKDLIEAAKLCTAPRSTIGRGMKVSKEDMVAMWSAVKRFVELDPETEQRQWEHRIRVIAEAVKDVPTVRARTIVPPVANHVPHLLLLWDEGQLPISPEKVRRQLATGDPPIRTARVHGTGTEGLLISVFMLEPGEDQIVAGRLRAVLLRAVVT